MGFFESVKGVTGAVMGFCGLCGVVGTGAVFLNKYQAKIDSIDLLESRLSKLEARGSAGFIAGPEGPRGSDGKPGKQGDTGPQGERGPTGPKGEVGVAPVQIAEFERRISALEKRPAVIQREPSVEQAQVGAAGTDTPVQAVKGLRKNEEGCYFLTPDFDSVSAQFAVGDKMCTVDGRPGLSISRISDDAVFFDVPGRRDMRCPVYSDNRYNCGRLVFNNRVTLAVRAVKMDAVGVLKATLEFRSQ